MRIYETSPPEKTGAENEAAAAHSKPNTAKEAVSEEAAAEKSTGGFCLTLVQTLVCVLVLLAALFLRGFLPEMYGELRAKYDDALNRSLVISQDDVPHL